MDESAQYSPILGLSCLGGSSGENFLLLYKSVLCREALFSVPAPT